MTNPWDIAAGALILERAGGRFVALSRGATLAAPQAADDYYGVGAGADYPTLDRVAREVSSPPAGARRAGGRRCLIPAPSPAASSPRRGRCSSTSAG